MKIKRSALLHILFIIVLFTVALAGCGNTCETDGHSYELYGKEAKCSKCGEICSHQFKGKNEILVCKECGYTCEHVFDTVDNKKICKECGYICKHRYDSDGNNLVCKICKNTVDKLDYVIGFTKANGEKDEKGKYTLTVKDGNTEYSIIADENDKESLVIKIVDGSYILTITDKFLENKCSYTLRVEVEKSRIYD